ncbi:hypothetical protein N2152v2_004609 [Parachlorella kessleri]
MPNLFLPRQFVLDTWRTDVRGSDFALVTCGPVSGLPGNDVLAAPDVFQQRHMVHCSTVGMAVDNTELPNLLATTRANSGASSSGACEVRLEAQRWPPVQEDPLLADLDSDVLQHMQPAARADRPCFVWLSAVPDELDAASLGANLRSFLVQQLQHAAAALPSLSAAVEAFLSGEASVQAHPTLRHPSWPSDGQLTYELAATHAAAAAGSSPAFGGDSPGGSVQLELDVTAVVQRYAASRACSPIQVELRVLGTRVFREKRQHALVVCTAGDAGLEHIFGAPLQPIEEYNLRQQQEGAGEVVVQPDSGGHGLTWWVQSSISPTPADQERTLPWKTSLNLDATKRSSCPISAAAYNLGNEKYDALELALYFPTPGTALQLPVRRVLLRHADALRPCSTGSVPRPEEDRVPSVAAVEALALAGLPLLAAPELVRVLKEAGNHEVLQALGAQGAIRKPSPRKEALSPALMGRS